MSELQLADRLSRIEEALQMLLQQRFEQSYYSTAAAAKILGKAEFTVREWCRHGRIRATRKSTACGPYRAWAISHDELLRYRREGLLPIH